MHAELFVIEILSEAEQIIAAHQKNRNRLFKILALAALGCGLFFFGLSTMIYSSLQRKLSDPDLLPRLTEMYQLAFLIGALLLVLLLVTAIGIIIWSFYLRRDFGVWIAKKAPAILQDATVFQDDRYYYFEKIPLKKKYRLEKSSCQLLTTTLDGLPIMLGQRNHLLGLQSNFFFILSAEPPVGQLPAKFSLTTQHLLWISAVTSCLLLIGALDYLSAVFVDHPADPLSEWPTKSEAAPRAPENGELVVQQGSTPTQTAKQSNALFLDQTTSELFMTTDAGLSWTFVPIPLSGLRFGSYLLTSGEPPLGYWLDQSFGITADFSWFIFSMGKEDVSFLTTRDHGQTWDINLVADNQPWIRYRKAQFFDRGSGVLVFSVANDVSSQETVYVCTTSDYGVSWHNTPAEIIDQPVQNVSFLSQMRGFVATREKLYYTRDSGLSFQEAVVEIPEDYQTGGLDLFQSPDEIIQTDDLLEAQFYLLNTGSERGKMFACRYQSQDDGATWQFVEQLSEVK